jgi:hypothetical protein
MVIKRTFQNHSGLIFNSLRDFIGGGGVKTAKVLCGANDPFPKKRKKISERKKKKRILSVSNALFLCWWVISPLSV